jgi:DNA polymerase III alpha subunit
LASLPRNGPKKFYDLVVQVAIIRPGPIVGKMMHSYMRRRQGKESVRYAHPSLEPILKRTLGVPLFQEQLLRMAMVAANFPGGEAEDLRRAMEFKRSEERMKKIEAKLRSGRTQNGQYTRVAGCAIAPASGNGKGICLPEPRRRNGNFQHHRESRPLREIPQSDQP